MKATGKIIVGLCCAALLIGNTALAQVINGGFETASGGYTTGALGWSDNSAPANNGSTASAQRNLLDPFAGAAELTLTYQNSAEPGHRSVCKCAVRHFWRNVVWRGNLDLRGQTRGDRNRK